MIATDDADTMTSPSSRPEPARTYSFVTDDDSPCYVVVWTGDVTVDALKRFFADVVKLPVFPARRGVIHDLRRARIAIDFHQLDTARLDHDLAIHADNRKPPLAYVVESAHQFGQIRQYIAKVQIENEVLVTYSEDEAKAFVGLPKNFDLTAGA